MDSKLYPQGKTPHFSKYANGVLKFFKRSTGAEMFAIDGVNGTFYQPGGIRVIRRRCTAAEINTGTQVVVPAVPGHKIRIVDASMVAYGGAATTVTTVDLITTQGASAVRPMVTGVAALTQSAKVSMGEAPAAGATALLADGASYVANDSNTAVIASKQSGGSGLAGATGVDVTVVYELIRG
jgi:hypothetical protein